MEKPQRMEGLAYKTIDSETIVLDSKIGKEVHELNEVATFIWNLCDGEHTQEEIVEALCLEYDAPFSQIKIDFENILEEFSRKFLLKP